MNNIQLFVYQKYTLPPHTKCIIYTAIAALTNGQQDVFEPSETWKAKECLLPRQSVTIDHSKLFIPIKNTTCSDLPVLLHSTDILGDLFPLLWYQQPVSPLHAMLPKHVDSIQINDNPNSKSPSIHRLSLKEFSEYFDFSKSCLTSEQIKVLLNLLYEYDKLFVKTGETLRMTHMMEMDIKLKPDATKLKAKPYRTSPEMRKEINRQIDDMLKADIIELSEGQLTSAVFLVPKKGKSFCLVVDYRKLNQQMIPENFSMQNITDLLQALDSNHPTIFTTLDMQSGYHQIPIKPSAREYTNFITPDNVYQFQRDPFSLTNCPFVLSKLMSKVLQGLVWDIALVYLDDIICFTTIFEDHIQALQKIFDRLQQANLSLKPSKCKFG
jgi:hypothetical protein